MKVTLVWIQGARGSYIKSECIGLCLLVGLNISKIMLIGRQIGDYFSEDDIVRVNEIHRRFELQLTFLLDAQRS